MVIGDLVYWRMDRIGRVPPPTEAVVARARAFGAALSQTSGAVLLARHDGYSTVTYVGAPAGSGDNVARSLAAALGAKATPAANPCAGMASAARVGWLRPRPDMLGAHEAQAGGDPSEVAMALTRVLVDGSWVCVSLRKPTRSERQRCRVWFKAAQVGLSHYSSEAEALVATCWAGAPTAADLRQILSQVASALPGFEVNVDCVVAARATWAPPVAASATAWALGAATGHFAIGEAVSVLAGATGLSASLDILPSTQRRLRASLAKAGPPRPASRKWPPRPPRPERVATDGSGRVRRAHPGDWPLGKRSFLVGSAMVVGVASPHGGEANMSTVQSRPVPASLTEDIGPLVGMTAPGQAVHISSAPDDIGVAVLGIPGTGKTGLVQALWAWSCLERAEPSHKPHRPGENQVLVAFETKEISGSAAWVDWARVAGVEPLVVSLTEISTPAIDVFAGPGSVAERASRVVNAMIYAFGDQAIQGRSTEALMAGLCGAMCAKGDVAERAGLKGASALRMAHVLLGGEGDRAACRLAAALAGGAHVLDGSGTDQDLADALVKLAPLFDQGVTAATRRTLCEAGRNKLAILREAGHWFSPERRQISWDDVIAHDGVVVVVICGDQVLNRSISAMLAYCLRDSITRCCAGWQAKGRSVGIFADELGRLAGTSPEVVAWLRTEGRSFGVRPVLATQYPEQLEPLVRTALLSFGSTFWFRQNVPSVVIEATNYLNMAGGGEWGPEDLDGLEPFHAVLRASVGGRGMPPVVVSVPFFAGDMGAFRQLQGWPALPVLPA